MLYVKYTRTKDIIESTIFVTIIVFFIITAFVETLSNKSIAKKLSQEHLSGDFNNTVFSNNITNEINNSKTNSNQNNVQTNKVNNIMENNIVNSSTTVNNNATSKKNKSNEIKDKSNKWRIEIPKIGLNAPIKEGTTPEILLEAVGHFTETTKDKGNVGLAAHNRGYECNFFERIKELKKGDKIIYKTANKTRTYLVETNTVIKQTNWNYLEPTKNNRITLITCEKDRKEYRRCIQAIEVS
mgnify:FL=1